jgi:hypothetical protein
MDTKEERMFFAAMALIGLVLRGESPTNAAKMAQDYAQAMMKENK